MKIVRHIINKSWITACLRASHQFNAALQSVETTQNNYLLNLLQRNAGTKFGVEHGFSKIKSVAEFQQRVPFMTGETLARHVEAIAAGETGVLTAEPVRRFMPTSGTTAGTKLIPWTDSLAKEFRRGISPWMVSTYTRRPALMNGTAYWSVSPPVSFLSARGKIPVGFDDDSEYLGFLGKQFFRLISSVPTEVTRCNDPEEFKTQTLLHLLSDENLSLISVWSPTFLTILLEHLARRQDEILDRLPGSQQRGADKRTKHLRSIASTNGGTLAFDKIWPMLELISCWTHGPSASYAKHIQSLFPNVEIQGKGLVATEAFVSLPFATGSDPVLAVNSHFYEFRDAASSRLFQAHELAAGSEYDVIVTTGGGLYRYPLGDSVKVTGFIGTAPCFRFIGRKHAVSDLFGEKLHATFVERIVERALSRHGIEPRFFLLAPVADGFNKTGYVLFLDAASLNNPRQLACGIDEGLCDNFHYAHCRRLGQLLPVQIFHIDSKEKSALAIFSGEQQRRGIKPGDVKTAALDARFGWERSFPGRFLEMRRLQPAPKIST